MCNRNSPAKTLRNVKRMARFNDKQRTKATGKQLSISVLSPIDIPPREKYLDIVRCASISISKPDPITSQLSFSKTSSTDLPPDPLPCFYCDLICPKPNLPETPTSPYEVCYICQKPLSYFARDPMECCGTLFHENCWGEHLCKNWIDRWCLLVPMVLWSPCTNWPTWHQDSIRLCK